eukprot:167678-Hanusia_phi.AAC.1
MMGLGVQPMIGSQAACMGVQGLGGLMVQNGFGNHTEVVPPYVVLPGITVATMTQLLANSVNALQNNAAVYRTGMQIPGMGIPGVPVGVVGGGRAGGAGSGGPFLIDPSLPTSSASVLSRHDVIEVSDDDSRNPDVSMQELSTQLNQTDGNREKVVMEVVALVTPVPTLGTVWNQTNLGLPSSAKREKGVGRNSPSAMSSLAEEADGDDRDVELGCSTHNMRLLSKVCEEIEKSSFSAVYNSRTKKNSSRKKITWPGDAPHAPSWDEGAELQAEKEAIGVQEEEGCRPSVASKSSSGYKTKEPSIAELCHRSVTCSCSLLGRLLMACVKRKSNPQEKDQRCDTVGKKLDEDLDRAIQEKDPRVIRELQAKLAADHGLSVKVGGLGSRRGG